MFFQTLWMIVINNRDYNIDQNNRDYDFGHNRAALIASSGWKYHAESVALRAAFKQHLFKLHQVHEGKHTDRVMGQPR